MPRVLLVDDDIAEISAVKRVLSRAGHQPVLATNAADALAALAQSAPAVLLVGASCENGDAVRRFADAEGARGIPIVVLGEVADAPEGVAQLRRPVDPDQLVNEVAAAIAGAAVPAPARANGAPPSRKAAADALKARADELRRGAAAPSPPSSPKPSPEPSPKPRPKTAPPQKTPTQAEAALSGADAALAELASPTAPGGVDLDLSHDPGLEAILRRAEEAERAHAAEKKARARQADRAVVEARQRAEAEQVAVEKSARARAAEERARTEERARAEAERVAAEKAARARAAEERARAEEKAHAEEKARAESERRAREEAEARARAEAERREAEAEARRAEEEGRAGLESELERLRREAEDESRRRAADEEELRSAIASARAEMDDLRRRGDEEARRRADAEAEIARLAREAERKRAEAAGQPAPLDFPSYRTPGADPAPDPVQETARRRVAALRTGSGDAAGDGDDLPRAPVTRAPPPELRAGALADLPVPRLLALAARAEVTGRLDFEGDAVRSLYLEGGRLVGATSSEPAERVEELALRLGLVTRDQYRLVAGAAATLPTRRAAVVLLERGFLKPAELTGLVRRHTEEVAFGTFGEGGASFRWVAAEVPPDERTALERTTLQLAVEGVRRRWLEPQCERVLGGDATLLAPVVGGASPSDLGLSAEERRAVAHADGLRTLDEIVAASPLDALSTRQALAALVLVGALAVRTFQGGRPAAAATVAIDLARVRDKLDQVRRADYFTILGVGRLCTPHEVREAFERLRAELDPRRFQGVREEGLAERLDEIQRVLVDARDVLADDRLRGEYLRGLGE